MNILFHEGMNMITQIFYENLTNATKNIPLLLIRNSNIFSYLWQLIKNSGNDF